MPKLTCEQVQSLLSFYIEKSLTENLMKEVEYHINICSECKLKYFEVLNLYNNYDCSENKIAVSNDLFNDEFLNNQYNLFMDNLSAYLDNELDEKENIRIKKISITNQNARLELENMLYFRYLLKSAFDVTCANLKKDYSSDIINSLYNISKESKVTVRYKYIIIFFILVYLIIFLETVLN